MSKRAARLTRRTVMTGLAAVPAAGLASAKRSKSLVAYLSRSGNTRVVAGLIQRAVGADLFEIQPATPYPDDYLKTVAKATAERDQGFEPPLVARVSGITQYDTV